MPSPGTHVKTEAGAEEGRRKVLELVEGATQDKQTVSNTIPTGGVNILYMHIFQLFFLFCAVLVTAIQCFAHLFY